MEWKTHALETPSPVSASGVGARLTSVCQSLRSVPGEPPFPHPKMTRMVSVSFSLSQWVIVRVKCNNGQQAPSPAHSRCSALVASSQVNGATTVALTCPSGRPGSAQWTPADWWARAPRCTREPTRPPTSPALHPRSAGGGETGTFRVRDGCKEPKML